MITLQGSLAMKFIKHEQVTVKSFSPLFFFFFKYIKIQ